MPVVIGGSLFGGGASLLYCRVLLGGGGVWVWSLWWCRFLVFVCYGIIYSVFGTTGFGVAHVAWFNWSFPEP